MYVCYVVYVCSVYMYVVYVRMYVYMYGLYVLYVCMYSCIYLFIYIYIITQDQHTTQGGVETNVDSSKDEIILVVQNQGDIELVFDITSDDLMGVVSDTAQMNGGSDMKEVDTQEASYMGVEDSDRQPHNNEHIISVVLQRAIIPPHSIKTYVF